MRLHLLARELAINTERVVRCLKEKGIDIPENPNTRLTAAQVAIVREAHQKGKKTESIPFKTPPKKPTTPTKPTTTPPPTTPTSKASPKLVFLGKIDFMSSSPTRKEQHTTPTHHSQTTYRNASKYGRPIQTGRPHTNTTSRWRKSPTHPQQSSDNKPTKPYTPSPFTAAKKNPYPPKPPSRDKVRKKPSYKPKNRHIPREGKKTKKEPHDTTLQIPPFIKTQELAHLFNIPLNDFIAKGEQFDLTLSANQRLERDIIELFASEYKKPISIVEREETTKQAPTEKERANLPPRPPIVVVMGHVDHGKTTLLDYLRKSTIAAKEKGNITQHIGAYNVTTKKGSHITFLDTPGHKAFTTMRTRGALLTDIAIIVIAADDGLMAQTEEAIKIAELQGCTVIFAINKVDKPSADIEKVKNQLAQKNYLLEDWGGTYQSQQISAKTGKGITELLEKIEDTATILSLTANPEGPAKGVVLESTLVKGRGHVLHGIVREGSLGKGDLITSGLYYGAVKSIFDENNKPLKRVLPSMPAQIIGLNGSPPPGSTFKVVDTIQEARALASEQEKFLREQQLQLRKDDAMRKFKAFIGSIEKAYVNIIIKADAQGSAEALEDILTTLSDDNIIVKVLSKEVGPITESDVQRSSQMSALLIGFHTKVEPKAKATIRSSHVDHYLCDIIYEAYDHVAALLNKKKQIEKEFITIGSAEVVKIFKIPNVGTIAGCIVRKGIIKRNAPLRIIRDGETIHEGTIKQLKHEQNIIKEAKVNTECGINITKWNDVQVGDIIESLEEKEIAK